MNTTEGLTKLLSALKSSFDIQKEDNNSWNSLLTLLTTCLDSSSSEVFSDSSTKLFFFNEFSGELANFISKLSEIKNAMIKETIGKVIKIYGKILLKEAPQDIHQLLSSLRWLFNPEAEIYRTVFADSKIPSKPEYEPKMDHSDWIKNIKAGMKIDAIKQEYAGNVLLECWAPAVVKKVTEDQIQVYFDVTDKNM